MFSEDIAGKDDRNRREPPAEDGPRAGCGGRWYVAQTQPHAEGRAIFHLERQGFSLFCPRIRKVVRHARKVTNCLAPLFPGYLFLNFDIARAQWRSVNGTYGVVGLIMYGETPQPIPVGVVELLREQVDEDGAMTWLSSLKVGQPVRISDGPFSGLVATLEHLSERGRVRVLIDLLGRSISVGLQSGAVVPAV
jgi:transcription elongation factor/antiterminator RfaH